MLIVNINSCFIFSFSFVSNWSVHLLAVTRLLLSYPIFRCLVDIISYFIFHSHLLPIHLFTHFNTSSLIRFLSDGPVSASFSVFLNWLKNVLKDVKSSSESVLAASPNLAYKQIKLVKVKANILLWRAESSCPVLPSQRLMFQAFKGRRFTPSLCQWFFLRVMIWSYFKLNNSEQKEVLTKKSSGIWDRSHWRKRTNQLCHPYVLKHFLELIS